MKDSVFLDVFVANILTLKLAGLTEISWSSVITVLVVYWVFDFLLWKMKRSKKQEK